MNNKKILSLSKIMNGEKKICMENTNTVLGELIT
jgi:hypothetical protein